MRARAIRLAFLTCALAALALSAPPAPRLAPAASAQEQRFGGQWLVKYRTEEGKTSLNYQEERPASDGRLHRSHWNETRNVAPESLVRMRDHGVSPDFIRRVKSRAGSAPTVEELIHTKNRGSY